ncbi:MAG: UDP-glucose/GDP-mannose dehydrogenase family protein [Deltaproteobacteria bacterium]|nr:UDP-glucose/GDP-mannose dehydrogenase family protein [Deltaproteobacteria bacterium]
MHICVVGTGYVGLVTGACFAELGVKVTCVDNDLDKISLLKKGRTPIYEPGLEELINKNAKEGRLSFTTDVGEAIGAALVIFIAVGTPQGDDGGADLVYVRQVAQTIGRCMNGYKVIVTKSTVPVGTGEMIKKIIEENQTEPNSFDVVSNPEFLREGSAIEDFMRPNRIVIGAGSDQAAAIMKDLYSPLYLIEAPIILTDVATSEMIKYASNAFLATKISFINEMANLCEKVGADVQMVAKGMGMDQRIGPKFLHAGAGFGGSCFPKDTQALAKLADENDYDFKIVKAVIRVNQEQRERMAAKIEQALGGQVKGKTIACLGLTFKPNTDDIREAPAEVILRRLLDQGAKVKAFDPAGMAAMARLLPDIEYGEDSYQVCQGADCLVLLTEWNQFRTLDWPRIKETMARPVVVDLRNVYSPEKMRQQGFTYYCVGRP